MQQQPERRGPLSVAATPEGGSVDPREPAGDVQAVLALMGRARGADQAAVAVMQTAILLLQEAVATLQAAADAKDVLATQVPLHLLREALAHRSGACRVEGDR